jgi:hypothetical protein
MAVTEDLSQLVIFFLHCEDLIFPRFCLSGWFWSHVEGVECNEQIVWESVPTRPFWPNLSYKEAEKKWLLGSGLLYKDKTK